MLPKACSSVEETDAIMDHDQPNRRPLKQEHDITSEVDAHTNNRLRPEDPPVLNIGSIPKLVHARPIQDEKYLARVVLFFG